MKFKTLQMKKTAFAMLVGLLLSVADMTQAFAADQIAVLQHEGVTTTYYGGSAFVNAYNAAENGDMITLSAGNFNACDITKLITIHGAGVRQDATVNDRTKTVFLNGFTFDCYGTETEHLTIEGVNFSSVNVLYYHLYYAEFYRCNFSGFLTHTHAWHELDVNDGNMSNTKFINCRISHLHFYGSNNVHLINSIVFNTSHLGTTSSTEKTLIAYNSFIAYGTQNIQCSDFNNCVIAGRSGYVLQETCTLYNCVMVKNGYEGSLLEYAFNRDCLEVDELSQVFVDYTGDFNDEQFVLQDGIASAIQGTDGTEVCIYGGMYPFYEIPKYMIMRRCTVGSRTTDDGHLSVDIEVVTE